MIINCYNSTKTICHTLNSLNLENDDIAVFVIDDGSTDHLKQKINYFLKKYRKTLFYFHKKNSNWGGCINFIRDQITSKYVSILDSDDEYNTNSFNQIINIMKTIAGTPDLLLVNYCLNFLDNGKIVKKRISKTTEKIKFKIFTKIKLFSFITIHATIFRSEIFKKIKLLPCHVCYTDTLLIYYALQRVKVIGYIDKNIYLYNYFIRKGNQSISMERSINNFNHFTLILEHLLKNPLPQNSAKKRIIVQAKIIKY
ncbi:glycosyltransferase family 2 protein [bacterium]|nr:glycosyltransferase family 2 protein [bacterium]